MKLIHLSDLHLGKRLNEFSLLDDQRYILSQILEIINVEKPNAVLIAGDVYDKPVPSAETVELFDDFLVSLSKHSTQIFVISGNHDSPERIAFGCRLMDGSGVHLSPVYSAAVAPYSLYDAYGPVRVYMLPFVKPANVRRFFPDSEISSYTDAVRTALEYIELDPTVRNVLITHQFVTGSRRSESEEKSVGGADNVDASVFEAFDYVALGHIHSPQSVCRKTLRYCGTPLKYSFSEAGDEKSVSVIELREKGNVSVRTIPLKPLRDLTELKGSYDELTLRSFYENTSWREDYVRITLTDETDIPDAMGKLRSVYHNIMELRYDNARTRIDLQLMGAEPEKRTPEELFGELFFKQNNRTMSTEQAEYARKLVENIWEDRQ